MTKLRKADFAAPALLLLLSFVPVLGGVVRLHSLSASASSSPEDARFLAAPVPVVIHLVAATVYALLGAFQFSDGLRARWPRWHRHAGALLVGCGFVVALSGVWMTLRYAIPEGLQGPLLFWVRLLVGVGMAASLAKGLLSVLRRDFAAHRAWMMRAYALAQGAGTQAVLMLPIILLVGPPLGLTRDLLMTAAWALNLLLAEWLICRTLARSDDRSRSRQQRVFGAAGQVGEKNVHHRIGLEQ